MTNIAEGRLQILQVYKLIQYVRQRNKAEIEKLLTVGVPHLVNLSEPSQGEYALHLAALANDVEICRLLLSLGAEPNVVDKDGRTAAMIAAEAGHDNVLEVLADANTDMSIVDKKGKGILYYCIAPTIRHLHCLEISLAHGADVNNCSHDGKPVFLLACEQAAACTEMCLQILEKGADPNSKFEIRSNTKTKNLQQKTPAAAAKANGHKAVSKELRKVERLITKYAKPDVKNPNAPWAIRLYDWSMYHELALRNLFATMDRGDGTLTREDFAAILMEKNAPMAEEEIAALISAHDKGRTGVIDINEFFKGTKYLEKVFLMSSYEPKKKKGKKGKRGKKGKVAIPIPICTLPEEHMIRREDGGPPEFMIESHKTFTDRNRFSRDNPPQHPLQDDSAWYLDKPEKVYTNINYAARAEDMQSLKKAFIQGVPVDVQDKFFTTPLMAACADGNYTLAKYLIESKANVNAYDNLLWTPLHHACHSGEQGIVELLLNAGASVNAVSINGATPLMRAIESCKLECVTYLINHGASVDMENNKGQNALDIANAYADVRITQVVKEKLDSLPKKEKPKKGGKGAKGGTSASSKLQATLAGTDMMTPFSTQPRALKSPKREFPKDSIARKSEMLNSGIAKKVDITFVPKTIWTTPPTTEELIQRRVQNREKFTYEVDFNAYLMPFKRNIKKKLEEINNSSSK
ncbi:ankyrin repeat and EF-hand domain-containing protein 1a [Chiloscyllium plagiosum]|uniref:ankyrin repeat and EF-hand domain-containing protein 1a n=1 Tax=Chiloscyllium plagiosum TaxID=36176 RepID=UPI001CB80514|nr:ankyrin repeat and EF-hand domain-containing protein 1a [Chiloscyllium plagiosum]